MIQHGSFVDVFSKYLLCLIVAAVGPVRGQLHGVDGRVGDERTER